MAASITSPKGVLEADRATGFDRLDHEALLRKLPANPTVRRPSNAGLKAGVVDNGALLPTAAGTPQGGVLTLPTKLPTSW